MAFWVYNLNKFFEVRGEHSGTDGLGQEFGLPELLHTHIG